MRISERKIPQLSLHYHDLPVNFLCKTIEEMEEETNDEVNRPHRHDYYTIIWIEKAEGVHHIDFKSYPIENNTIYFISPDQVHYVEIKNKASGYVLLFTADFLETNNIPLNFLAGLELFFACDSITPIKLKPDQLPALKSYVENILAEFRSDHYLKDESISTWLKLFLISCKRIKGERAIDPQPLLNNSSRITREFKLLLEKQYKAFHKVNDYAGLMHLSSNYLNEVIKNETGQSAKELIQSRIILEAKRLAAYSEHNLKETAYDLGFDDPAHFSKFFKNCAGMDYTAFKDQIRKKYL